MAAAPRPYFRTSLFPAPDDWSGGPGASHSIVRFGPWARWYAGADPLQVTVGTPHQPLLILEMPFSVLPFTVRQRLNIACDLSVPPAWQGHPVPRWRGVTCRWGTALLRLEDDRHPEAATDFPVVALLPDRDPAGPLPERTLLGA
jgi:hypothetical protein